MLRVEILDSADTLNLRLEGRFTGEDAEQTRMLLRRCAAGTRLVVDLTEVVFIDAVGEDVLSFFGRFGAQFIVPTSYTLDICERLNLPVVPAGNSHENTSRISTTNDGQCRPGASDPEKKEI
jgi:hypothetical protein